ncbi:MAG: SDR family NAD(P)-dependent oxidoreductase [Catenulispora sp.]|nr:SDR family NAD(P)-dependent oxidoreductase [Catenulispora sp.]
MPHWTPEEMPDLTGRVAMVTGASSGIGFQTALELARHGARTLLAVRDPDRGQSALERITSVVPSARGLVEVVLVDLASLDSIEDAAADLADRTAAVDILVNNAGVMVPDGLATADGFELQFGTNHLGHFALTGRLLPLLLAAEAPRVITVSSLTHRHAKPIWDFEPIPLGVDALGLDGGSENLDGPGDIDKQAKSGRLDGLEADGHRRVAGYGRSKLANLLFARELDRRAKAAGISLASIAAHPGYAATGLFTKTSFSRHNRVVSGLAHLVTRATGQSSATGAWPSLYAATHVDLFGGEYIGPRGPGEMRGAPTHAFVSAIAQDEAVAAGLWDQSVAATGVGYEELSR